MYMYVYVYIYTYVEILEMSREGEYCIQTYTYMNAYGIMLLRHHLKPSLAVVHRLHWCAFKSLAAHMPSLVPSTASYVQVRRTVPAAQVDPPVSSRGMILGYTFEAS
jgi:hypothetical protein